MQDLIPFVGTVPCACGKQPKHWQERNGQKLHFLECSPCGTRTAKVPEFSDALTLWAQRTVLRSVVQPVPKKAAAR